LNHSILRIPSHGPARLTGREADHHVGSDHELAHNAPQAGAQREVRDVRVGAHRAGHQREAAAKWGVDRSTVVHVCRTAKQGALDALAASVPGRPGQSAGEAALSRAEAEIGRLRATVTEQAVALHLHEGKAAWD
jgi:hypothetical protein